MTNNPLLQKYEELYGKKEEPKSQKIEMYDEVSSSTLTQKQIDDVEKYLKKASGASSGSYTSATNSTVSVQPSKLTSYDPHSGEGIFFETAEKIKNKDAKVISVTYAPDTVGFFSTGMITMTFQVQVWGTP